MTSKTLVIDKPESISYKLALDIAGDYILFNGYKVDKKQIEKSMFDLVNTKEIIPNCGDKNTMDKIKHNHKTYFISVRNTITQIKFKIRNA